MSVYIIMKKYNSKKKKIFGRFKGGMPINPSDENVFRDLSGNTN